MNFRLTLDGAEFTPTEFDEGSFSGSWEDDVLFSVVGPSSYTFYGDGYEYISQVRTDGYCNTIYVEIYLDETLVHTGLIFVSECMFDRVQCYVNTSVSDGDILAIIKNKEKQEYFVSVGKDSSNQSIAPVGDILIDFHDVVTGASAGTRNCYRVFDCLDFVLRAITDSDVLLISDFFGVGGVNYNLVFVTVQELISPSYSLNQSPKLSYEKIFEDLNTLYCLRGSMEVILNQKYLRIEPRPYFRKQGNSFSVDGLTSLKENIDASKIYSVLNCGSEDYRNSDTTPTTSYPDVNLVTWDKQVYNISGKCVTRNSLDLVTRNFIIDSNSIEASINGDDLEPTFIAIVETDGVSSIKYDTIGDGKFYYNQGLNNQSVIANWNTEIHNTVFSNDGRIFGDFEARLSADYSNVTPAPDYDDVISDPGGDYNPAALTGQYTLPSDGLYLFVADFFIEIKWVGINAPLIVLETILVPSNLFEYDQRFKTFTNPNADSFQVSTVKYEFSYTFARQDAAGTEYWLISSFSGIDVDSIFTYKKESTFKSSLFLLSSSVPSIFQCETAICKDDFLSMITQVDKKITLNGVTGYLKKIDFSPYSESTIVIDTKT